MLQIDRCSLSEKKERRKKKCRRRIVSFEFDNSQEVAELHTGIHSTIRLKYTNARELSHFVSFDRTGASAYMCLSLCVCVCVRACDCKCDEWESICVRTSRCFVNYRCECECECSLRLGELLIYRMMVKCLCFLKTMVATVCAHQIHTPTSLFWHIKIKFPFFSSQLPIWHLIHCFLVEFGWYFDSIGWCRPQRHFIICIVKWSRVHTFRKNVRANISNITQTICLKSYKKNYFSCSNTNALKFYRHFTHDNFFEKEKKTQRNLMKKKKKLTLKQQK